MSYNWPLVTYLPYCFTCCPVSVTLHWTQNLIQYTILLFPWIFYPFIRTKIQLFSKSTTKSSFPKVRQKVHHRNPISDPCQNSNLSQKIIILHKNANRSFIILLKIDRSSSHWLKQKTWSQECLYKATYNWQIINLHWSKDFNIRTILMCFCIGLRYNDLIDDTVTCKLTPIKLLFLLVAVPQTIVPADTRILINNSEIFYAWLHSCLFDNC